MSEVADGDAAARAPARRGPIARAIRNAGWLLGGKGVGGLLLVWAAAELAATLAMWIAAWHELRRRGLHTRAVVTPRGVVGENPGLWHFAWATKFSSSISALWHRLLVLGVGWIAGPAAAGGYRIAAQLAGALEKPIVSLARSRP